jgi:GntR family transcriptional repressor for pyruvate dehydrogenase complex
MGEAPATTKLYQQVAATLAEAIRSGAYPVGRRLPSERELAERFGVSRPTLREAMIALEIQGFVESRQGSGVYVTAAAAKLDPMQDLNIGAFELTEARRVVEAEACALAATSIAQEELDELERLLLAMAAASGDGGADALEAADRRFHVVIAGATRNSALVSVVEMLWDLRHRSPLCLEMLARARDVGDRPRIEEHRAIVKALAAHDSSSARAAMREHLTRVIEGLLATTEAEAVRIAREDIARRRASYAHRAAV